MAHFLCHLGCSHFGALLLDFHFTENTPAFLKESGAKNFVQSSALLLGMPPCGTGEGEVFFPAMERTKDRRGTAPMSAYAQRALIVTFPPAPFLRGCVPLAFV